MTTEDEEKNSSTSPSSRMPAPDQAPLEKDLPSKQPQPDNPRSEEPAVIPAVASLFHGTLDDDQDSDLPSMQPLPQPQPSSPKPEEAEPTPAATVGTTHEENTNTTSGPALNEGAENRGPANEDTEYAQMETYQLREHVSELMITLWNEGSYHESFGMENQGPQRSLPWIALVSSSPCTRSTTGGSKSSS